MSELEDVEINQLVERMQQLKLSGKTDLEKTCQFADEVIAVCKIASAKLDLALAYYKKLVAEDKGSTSDESGSSRNQTPDTLDEQSGPSNQQISG